MTTTLLVVEDNDGDALIIEELFSDHDIGGPMRIERCDSIAAARALLEAGFAPDCALLDLGLPDAVGTEGVEALTAVAPELPIVVLTGSNDPELAGEAFRAGAQDYLVKGPALDEEIARRTIRYSIDRSAQVRALRASRRELRDFAHRVAHDLKSPMAVVLGALELLQRSRPDGQDPAPYEMLARSGGRLVEMVDRLLEYADTAGSDEMLTTVDLDLVLEWVVQTLDSSLDDVDLEIRGPLGSVHANEVGLRHVFLNLITNSIKYAHPQRRPSVVVESECADDSILIAVRDNGIGIPPDQRSAVFTAGFRIDDTEPGTGLGLATVRRTMQLVGGAVSLEDGPDGVGSTFRLRLRSAGGS